MIHSCLHKNKFVSLTPEKIGKFEQNSVPKKSWTKINNKAWLQKNMIQAGIITSLPTEVVTGQVFNIKLPSCINIPQSNKYQKAVYQLPNTNILSVF